MKIYEAKYTRRFKTGEYEYEDFTLTATVESESGVEALTTMKGEVLEAFTGDATTETKPAKGGKAKPAKKGKKNAKPNDDDETDNSDDEDIDDADSESEDAGVDGEGDSDDEATDDEDGDDSDDSSDDDEDAAEAPVSGKKSSGKKAVAAKGKSTGKSFEKETAKKTFRKKPQNYNRTIEQHKEIFSGVLRSVAPDWKKNEASKKKAKLASEKMEGVEFLDENGEVVPAFKVAVKKLMAGK